MLTTRILSSIVLTNLLLVVDETDKSHDPGFLALQKPYVNFPVLILCNIVVVVVVVVVVVLVVVSVGYM